MSAVKLLRGAASDLVRLRTRADQDTGARLEHLLAVLDEVLLGAVEGVSSSLLEAALTDPLTGCGNRRALEDDLERAVAGARRTGLDLSVAVIDLDGLKRINDTHGHAEGDATLKALAKALVAAVRRSDVVYRVGGDEFIVLVPFSGQAAAEAIMRRANDGGAPSFSWGVATLSRLAPGAGPDDLVAVADASLYARRRSSRPESPAGPPRRRILLAVAALALAGISGVTAYDRYSVRAPDPGSISHGHVETPPVPESTTPPTSHGETALPHKQSGAAKTSSPGVDPTANLAESDKSRAHHAVPLKGSEHASSPTRTVSSNPLLTDTLNRTETSETAHKAPALKTPHVIAPPHIRATCPVARRRPLHPGTPPVATRVTHRHRCGIGGIDIFQRCPHDPVDLRFGHDPDWNFPY